MSRPMRPGETRTIARNRRLVLKTYTPIDHDGWEPRLLSFRDGTCGARKGDLLCRLQSGHDTHWDDKGTPHNAYPSAEESRRVRYRCIL